MPKRLTAEQVRDALFGKDVIVEAENRWHAWPRQSYWEVRFNYA